MNPPVGVGTVLDGRFRLTSRIGEGALTRVYEAVDASTGGRVVVKVPVAGADRDPLFLARLEREESIGVALRHPSVVRVLALEKKSRPYLVMEKVEGTPLSSLVGEGRALPVSDALRITAEVLRAVDYLHRNRVIHRDLKPANVMLSADGSVRVLDLGLATVLDEQEFEGAIASLAVGTPDYMPPEQVEGKAGDGRSDVYSVGAMLYEMLTGSPPFSGDDLFAVMHARVVGDPGPPRRLRPDLSPQLEELLLRALARDPAERYPSVAEFLRDVERPGDVVLTGRASRLKTPSRGRILWRRIRDFVWAMAVMMGFFAAMALIAWASGGRRP